MKKKILTLCLCVAMAAVAVVGGTLAYFTDKDEEINTFTVGNISIDLKENYLQDSELMPGKDITKEIWIENDGDNSAYVWYEFLIPAVLDSTDGKTGTNNILHVNALGRTWDTYRTDSKYWADGQKEALPLDQTWDHDANVELKELIGPEGFIGTEVISGITYNKYVVLYHGVVAPNAGTSIAMSKVYLDPKVDAKVTGEGKDAVTTYYLVKNGVEEEIKFNLEDAQIIVNAYGIQAEALTDADGDGDVDVYDAYTLYNVQY